jgi:CRISPR-associated protein (TIGR03984 family)
MEANGLKLISVNSTSEPASYIRPGEFEIQLKAFMPESAFVVVFLDDRVLAGRWTGNLFQFYKGQTIEEKHIQRVRVFNQNKEFHAWRTSNGMKTRKRTDFLGTEVDVVIAEQVLFGTMAKNKGDGFTEIFEKRGTRLCVPFKNLMIDEKKNRLFIKTHNYIGYNPVGQATYTDCRFVSFNDGKKELI